MVTRIISVFVAVLLGTFFLGQTGVAQSKKATPDFTGVWQLDRTKGNYSKISGLKSDADLFLVISQSGSEIKVSTKTIVDNQERIWEAIYHTDGREEPGRSFYPNLEGRSRTGWDGNRLVSRLRPPANNLGWNPMNLEIIQEWKLSSDGKTLTQTQKFFTTLNMIPPPRVPTGDLLPAESNAMKRVFNKIS